MELLLFHNLQNVKKWKNIKRVKYVNKWKKFDIFYAEQITEMRVLVCLQVKLQYFSRKETALMYSLYAVKLQKKASKECECSCKIYIKNGKRWACSL